MALGVMGGAGGSWDEDEKKKKAQPRSAGVLGVGGIGQYAQQAAARNQAAQEVRTAYNPTEQSRANNSAVLNGLGVNIKNPYISGAPKPTPLDKSSPSVFAGRASELASQPVQQPIKETYAENAQPSTAPRIGFDLVRNPQTIQNNTTSFRMPNAPRRTMAEQQERQALLRDASTAYKGSQNGQLTAKQMELRAGIIGADDKYKNDQYGAQLSAASQLAQTQMTQAGANERAALGEENANNRFNSQLGFDAGKFQQTAEQQQQANNLASRRLDIEQSNADVANFAPKQLNALYEKYDTAKTDSEKSEIAKQIQALKGTATDKEYWTNIGGGETLSADGLTSIKNPDILLNRNTGETRAIPAKPIDYETDPRAQAIINDRSLSKDERRKQLEALR